jgi:hypothetical protein
MIDVREYLHGVVADYGLSHLFSIVRVVALVGVVRIKRMFIMS